MAWTGSAEKKEQSTSGLHDQEPEIALEQAKQDFAHWLTGTAGQPDYTKQIQQDAQNTPVRTSFVYSQDKNGFKYKVEAGSSGQLKHASLGP